MDAGFVDRMERAAKGRRARIGIGVDGGGPEIVAGIEGALEFAEIVMVGDPGPDFEIGQKLEILSQLSRT